MSTKRTRSEASSSKSDGGQIRPRCYTSAITGVKKFVDIPSFALSKGIASLIIKIGIPSIIGVIRLRK